MAEGRVTDRHARRSLRSRLVALIGGLVLTTTVVVLAVAVLITSASLDAQLDDKLEMAVTNGLGSMLGDEDDLSALGDPASIDLDSVYLATAGSFQAIVDGGRVLSSTLLTERYDWAPLTAAEQAAVLAGARPDQNAAEIRLGDDTFRTITVPLDEPEAAGPVAAGGAFYVVGITRGPADATLVRLLAAGLAATAVAVLVAVLGAGRAVRRSLAPLDQVVDVADQVARTPLTRGAIDLPDRVPPGAVDRASEVGRVGLALNRLLDHVHAALLARQRAEDAMARFIAEASHELRNPLTSIRGYADHYASAVDVPPGARAGLQRIAHESTRLGSLVEELLALARLDAGRVLATDPVDVSLLVIETVGDAQVAFGDHRWDIELPAEPVVVPGDEQALRQVLVNLLGNAGTHTPPGSSVVVRACPAGGAGARIEVVDDGPGIAPDVLPVIFDRFRQGTPGTGGRTRRAGSVGLGLAIVEALVRAWGGTVGVESRPGRTVFAVTVPAPGTEVRERP